MSTDAYQIVVDGLPVDVVRKPIKNLHLGVYPPNGRVRVAAPLITSDDAIRLAVVSRLAWIKRQQAKFDGQDRQSAREFVSGESHYFLGRRYRLNVSEHKGLGTVAVRNGHIIDLAVREGTNVARREKVLLAWYRAELKALAAPFIEKWAKKLDLPVPDWGVKRMKTKWGSCSINARRIWLNLELIKKPIHCTEYIVLHEMLHFLVRHHNDRFVELMEIHMPQWRLYRDELNSEPLAHEHWDY